MTLEHLFESAGNAKYPKSQQIMLSLQEQSNVKKSVLEKKN